MANVLQDSAGKIGDLMNKLQGLEHKPSSKRKNDIDMLKKMLKVFGDSPEKSMWLGLQKSEVGSSKVKRLSRIKLLFSWVF